MRHNARVPGWGGPRRWASWLSPPPARDKAFCIAVLDQVAIEKNRVLSERGIIVIGWEWQIKMSEVPRRFFIYLPPFASDAIDGHNGCMKSV